MGRVVGLKGTCVCSCVVVREAGLTATLQKRFYDPATQQVRGIDCLLLTHADPEDAKQAVEVTRVLFAVA